MKHDYDFVVVGSGFGGSVSAMRLSQKGYTVCVIESGKRWKAEDFAERNWNLRKFLWMPDIGLYGIQRMNFLKDIFILSGAGVGGGSLNYANTLYVPPESFFEKDSVKYLGGKEELLPYYTIASKMLGVTPNQVETEQDIILKELITAEGRGDTYSETPVGVYFGDEGKRADDPYFYGEGPERIGCELCGACMTGCKKDAKNTLDKNYLFFAEKFGTEIIPEQKVIKIRPLSEKGEEGYELTTQKTTGFFRMMKGNTITAKHVVLSAGTLGTLSLLFDMKTKGILPYLSNSLGKKVRTNSEAITGIKSRNSSTDYSKGVAITSSIYLDDNTHVEPVRYAAGNDFMSFITVLMTDGGGKIPRQLKFLWTLLRHPRDFFTMINPFGWAKRAFILLVMQTHDNYINLKKKRRLVWPFKRSLTSEQATDKKNPVYIPIANNFTRKLGEKVNGVPMSVLSEVVMNAPLTAHIMGGCAISEDGVIDHQNRVNGYENLWIADGSQIPENLGVNPSLSITAFSERAMSFIPPKDGKTIQYLKAEKEWELEPLLTRQA